MIRVKLLGGARKALGRDAVEMDVASIPVSELLQILKSQSTSPSLLRRENLIVAINGSDASSRGDSAQVKDGDEVTIVTVVHGGVKPDSYIPLVKKIGDTFVMIIGLARLAHTDTAALLENLRSLSAATLQVVDSGRVYGSEHIFGAVAIALKAESDGIAIGNSLEVEILVRLAGTSQISEAIKRTGIKTGSGAIVIALSDNEESLATLLNKVSSLLELDPSQLDSGPRKARSILKGMGLTPRVSMHHAEIESFLIERAAIISK